MFIPNLIEYHKTGHIGKCPNCGADLKVDKYATPIRDNFLVKCPNCKREEYFTGMTKK